MHNVHTIYWDRAHAALCNILAPPCPTDRKLRSVTQWRRAPWGIRVLDKDAPILGLSKGRCIPQLVLREKLLRRAPRNSTAYAVPPEFNMFCRPSRARSQSISEFEQEPAGTHELAMLEMVQEICAAEWESEYPKPASILRQNGEWLIKFHNHSQDRNPSTIVLGPYRKLELAGKHSYTRDFFLPDQMTAQELGDHVYACCGRTFPTLPPPQVPGKRTQVALSTDPPQSWLTAMADSLSRDIDPLKPHNELIHIYRQRFATIISDIRVFSNDCVIKSVEGFGKTTQHFGFIASESFDDAVQYYPNLVAGSPPGDSYNGNERTIRRFGCFAFRSHDQACQKAAECRKAGHKAVVVQSFRRLYETTCSELGNDPLPAYYFHDASPRGILAVIKGEQPDVFERLKEIRAHLWDNGSFDAATTTVFTTHALVRSWRYGRMTRTWYHPGFDSDHECDHLRDQFALGKVVFDELELDEFLHILPVSIYELLNQQQEQHPGWRNIPRFERYSIFSELRATHEPPAGMDFEEFNELMRLELSEFRPVDVDYDAIPFGNDNTPKGIYRREHGKRFYIGIQEWPLTSNIHFTFLTTEHLMTEILMAIYRKHYSSYNPLLRLDLDHVPGIYPISVPLYIDRRAAADRSNPKVSKLAREIVTADSNAIVISNGVEDQVERVITFQKAKGQNDLKTKNIFVILTNLAPEQYARLNVVGQWLNIPDIIPMYYEDQINQAV